MARRYGKASSRPIPRTLGILCDPPLDIPIAVVVVRGEGDHVGTLVGRIKGEGCGVLRHHGDDLTDVCDYLRWPVLKLQMQGTLFPPFFPERVIVVGGDIDLGLQRAVVIRLYICDRDSVGSVDAGIIIVTEVEEQAVLVRRRPGRAGGLDIVNLNIEDAAATFDVKEVAAAAGREPSAVIRPRPDLLYSRGRIELGRRQARPSAPTGQARTREVAGDAKGSPLLKRTLCLTPDAM